MWEQLLALERESYAYWDGPAAELEQELWLLFSQTENLDGVYDEEMEKIQGKYSRNYDLK